MVFACIPGTLTPYPEKTGGSMRKIVVFLATAFLIFGVFSFGHATLLFEDNFNSENGGIGALNYTGFANWQVSDGTVDLIGNGYFDFQPGNGLYVDMDGSTVNAGILTSIGLSLSAGSYLLSFDLAGNFRNGEQESVTVEVAMGGLFSNTYFLTQNTPFTTFTESFTVGSDQNASISFEGQGGDNVGMLLDNIRLETASVPEPSTLLLLGMGVLGMAGYGRRKIKNS